MWYFNIEYDKNNIFNVVKYTIAHNVQFLFNITKIKIKQY